MGNTTAGGFTMICILQTGCAGYLSHPLGIERKKTDGKRDRGFDKKQLFFEPAERN